MDLAILIRKMVDEMISDILFWGKPEYAAFSIKLCVGGALGALLGLYFVPLRYFIVLGLWGSVL
jgi:hypothetical protein